MDRRRHHRDARRQERRGHRGPVVPLRAAAAGRACRRRGAEACCPATRRGAVRPDAGRPAWAPAGAGSAAQPAVPWRTGCCPRAGCAGRAWVSGPALGPAGWETASTRAGWPAAGSWTRAEWQSRAGCQTASARAGWEMARPVAPGRQPGPTGAAVPARVAAVPSRPGPRASVPESWPARWRRPRRWTRPAPRSPSPPWWLLRCRPRRLPCRRRTTRATAAPPALLRLTMPI